MKYVGLQAQKTNNNIKSTALLFMFPLLVLVLVYAFALFVYYDSKTSLAGVNDMFLTIAPFVVGGIVLWFIIAYFYNTKIINLSTGSETLSRRDNKRVYNLVENLCMANGMPMPKVNVINDQSLNAFASGINEKTYTVTLTQGIIEKLNDDELEGVIAHELSHIRNNDVRLLIISIVFVGIFSFLMGFIWHIARVSSFSRNRNEKGGIVIIVVVLVLAAIGYFFSSLFKFAISRKREYMADASAAEMTKKPAALAGALRKISKDNHIESITNEDVAQLFIEHSKKKEGFSLSSLFSTHPPIKKRIQVLEQF